MAKRKITMMKGNTAAAHVSYAFTEVAGIYPITPSSDMAEETDSWAAKGKKNMFGDTVKVVEMQSEAGAAATVHGSLQAGALTTTYTASQGLLLMIPTMYKIAGELLPSVIHVSARAVAAHALSIFGDHSDINACRATGYAMLASTNPQEVMDLGAVAHLASLKGRVPFVHFFDGFRTSHEMQKIEEWSDEDLKELADMAEIDAFRSRALNPEKPVLRGTAQNPDIFFQAKEAANPYYDKMPEIVQGVMDKVNAKIGTDYKLFNYYGAPDAEQVIVAMGSSCDTIEETIDYLVSKGEKVGLIKVRLYLPFAMDAFVGAIPASCKKISVLDRTKEPGSIGEPLYLSVVAALKQTGKFADAAVYAGRYGLGSKDFNPACVIAAYRNSDKKRFTVGINDDVTNLSLKIDENPNTVPEGTTSCKFWGIGGDGTVSANENSTKIIGANTDNKVQAYFAYDSKKAGGVTISHLRFGKAPIKSTYFITKANFVACHKPDYVMKYDMVKDILPGGTFLLNCQWTAAELEDHLPNRIKSHIAKNNINFYIINGIKIAGEVGLGNRISTVLQSAFFKLANIIPIDDAIKHMKEEIHNQFISKGQKIVDMNYAAVEAGANEANIVKVEIPAAWASAGDDFELPKADSSGKRKEVEDFVNNILIPVNAYRGADLPVSTFAKDADGTFPQGSAAYEKRGVAVDVPEWICDNCIQCNQCAYVCPHAILRPYILTDAEVAAAPAGLTCKDATGLPGFKYTMGNSVLDCYGCGVCVNVCPAKENALVMKPLETQLQQQNLFAYLYDLPEKPETLEKFKETSVKGSQFKQPLLEFSGACAGCGETPYAKLVTQLFGDRMYIGNATGCSSIWGGSAPATPYTVNKEGKGPSWANSLFEDTAEFSYGMFLGQQAVRDRLKRKTADLIAGDCKPEVKAAAQKWIDTYCNGSENACAAKAYIAALEACDCAAGKEILKDRNFLAKKSVWAFGGDGWAYDIGYGGLDHVLAEGQDVNLLVFDTEVYSNTGGQASKATPLGAIAKFAANGMNTKKKDLAAIAMQYDYVYVAQVSMGADMNQCIKAMVEAENHPGPSIVICYAPCRDHGIKGGLANMIQIEKAAVESGYWHLFRYNPGLVAEGKSPYTLDSKAPTASYKDFLMNEVRYNSLMRQNPERAEKLFDKAEKDAKKKYDNLVGLIEYYKV
ncbi:MAG: pyruvate:ferredoxin (flavodoxin) oxidoreductase [Oscillospiraceae bacterium]|jgi:pyruvate-ferredoxin/flavodoxin oxidoreductase|nr:pyruvate:ferredoxin (flavodoxin) oxidoreductase [Oscillospiraceae bacterium]